MELEEVTLLKDGEGERPYDSANVFVHLVATGSKLIKYWILYEGAISQLGAANIF